MSDGRGLTGAQRLRNIRTKHRIIAHRQMRAFIAGDIGSTQCVGDLEDRAVEAEFDRVFALGLSAGRAALAERGGSEHE